MLEDWLDESIGTATRFVYYHFGWSKQIDPSVFSQLLIQQVVRRQYGITNATVELAASRLLLPWRNYQLRQRVLICW